MGLDLTQALTSLTGMVNGFVGRLPYLVLAALVYVCFHFAARLTRRLIRHLSDQRALGQPSEHQPDIAVPSFKPAQLIQILGIGGVAIGFAFRDILQNFLAGILILLTEPFHIGDQIIVEDFEGTVEEIETRATVIRTYDGRRVVIPNSSLFTESVTVNTAFPSRRLQYDIGIGYGDDVAHAKAVIRSALRDVHGVLADPAPEALVVDLAGSTVNIRARWWIAPPRRADVVASMDQALHAIRDALTGEGIDMPFPTQQILFHDQTEETDGDRSRQREGWPAGRGAVPKRRAREADRVDAFRA